MSKKKDNQKIDLNSITKKLCVQDLVSFEAYLKELLNSYKKNATQNHALHRYYDLRTVRCSDFSDDDIPRLPQSRIKRSSVFEIGGEYDGLCFRMPRRHMAEHYGALARRIFFPLVYSFSQVVDVIDVYHNL